ncbi:ras guanine nucleotide exchange factor domain-containing protein [Ilyonectria robusta]|uniref:ras guanine nucleotide exchange factor domain-containing protein n=1 Tax=Ilyonectria robusta TaxID=1079257 RepID=UPI001E8EAEC2|nr:ras guanine nucleotide exchange factor domain-containing protein [Ilyonectria robusta]KAH8694792.1 ras guanine nucleotide exchange factor domain-containing protein [Ilyonectria robusta]
MLSTQSMRASLQVAPLSFAKVHTESTGDGSATTDPDTNPYSQSHMTPPATPNGSQEDLSPQYLAPPVFHNFLRAFYPFNPSYAMSDTSVTLPLNEGDVILVHSIHTNGWADGTLLVSGARGWLPTNYCEAYEPDDMCSLLKALLNFWDLLRSTTVNDREIFGNQEFMKGIIAGVRFLLERTNCLNRESPFIQRNETLRKCRKSLLSELSSLVKSAKRLQESQRPVLTPVEDVNDIVDEMILKAFRIVTKGVRFYDVLDEDRRARAPASVTVMATVLEESYVPPTPPADQGTFDDQAPRSVNDTDSQAATSVATSESSESTQTTMAIFNRRLSSLGLPTGPSSHRLSQASLVQAHRLSASISHRVSLAGPSPLSRAHHLVSERLNRTHDTFLSHLGSFIGRLHLQSQSRPELASAIKQSALSGGELLAVVDGVYEHINSSSEVLALARATMFERIQDLVFSARDTLANAESEEADVIMPQDNSILLNSATGCVRAAGDCVAKAKVAIERIGDFEFELESSSLGIDLSILDIAPEERARTPVSEPSSNPSVVEESHRSSSGSSTVAPAAPRRLTLTGVDKPLPEVPQDATTPTEEQTPQNPSPASSRPSSANGDGLSSMASSISSLRPSLPPLPKLSTTLLPSEDYSPVDNHDSDFASTSRFDSMVASSAGSSATYLSRDSESSILSQSSTRATTPDHTMAPRNQPSMSELSTTDSSSHAEEVDEVESRLMEKTFAHELMFNKEGLVTGGSIQALVERLTTHESTPDAMFVSTFYLTFRLFCTPVRLAEALIERFDYVSESPHMTGPVRLRVYNAFKGWLESHWRDETDRDALDLIMPFSEIKLASVLPSAGRRLLELAQRVSGDGSLVPRLVSSMGKTSTSIAQYVPADTPLPQLAVSNRQINLLASFKSGTSAPTILDFDPVELARQLTIKQMNIFCSILPEELLGSQWMKKGGVSAPNVKAMSSLSTDLSNLVAETILEHPEIKKRAAVIKQWIKIAHQCLELHNYDGLMAIICSLNSSTISRLRKTWDAVSARRKEMLRTLQALVEPSQNNKVLRTRLHDHVPPCLPFLGMYLTDLTFVDIGNPATKQMALGNESEEDGSNGITVINFDKHTRTAKIIGELQRFQIPYRLTEIPDMQDWMTEQIRRVREGDQGNVQVTYYRKSLLLEPRETALRIPTEPQPTSLGAISNASRTDLFGWMSRDRSNPTPTPTPAQV